MPKLSDWTEEGNYFALHVGDSGSGKTCASASFGRQGKPIYFFDCDKRIGGAMNHPLAADWAPWVEYENIPQTAEGLEKVITTLERWKSSSCPFNTVVLSTITTFDDAVMKYADKYAGAPANKFGRYNMPGMSQYMLQGSAFDELIGLCKGMKTNVIIEAHWTVRYKSEGPGKPKTIPDGMQIAIRDKLAVMFPVNFNNVFFFKKSAEQVWNREKLANEMQVKYEVITDNELARTTIPGLPRIIDLTGKSFYREVMERTNDND